jgi:hypothetical protein
LSIAEKAAFEALKKIEGSWSTPHFQGRKEEAEIALREIKGCR